MAINSLGAGKWKASFGATCVHFWGRRKWSNNYFRYQKYKERNVINPLTTSHPHCLSGHSTTIVVNCTIPYSHDMYCANTCLLSSSGSTSLRGREVKPLILDRKIAGSNPGMVQISDKNAQAHIVRPSSVHVNTTHRQLVLSQWLSGVLGTVPLFCLITQGLELFPHERQAHIVRP